MWTRFFTRTAMPKLSLNHAEGLFLGINIGVQALIFHFFNQRFGNTGRHLQSGMPQIESTHDHPAQYSIHR